ncbi:hypothetical protein [Holdemania massiliensis]|uniref:hypothetical protein n=1 Tax=Holdemania massiliensis TaxID=1468449 RepID=UPI003564FF9E
MQKNYNLRCRGKILKTTSAGDICTEDGELLFTLDEKNCTVTIANEDVGLTANFSYIYNQIRTMVMEEMSEKQAENSKKYSLFKNNKISLNKRRKERK